MNIRLLKADEIECRIGMVKEGKGMSLLLYKDARADMKILDETFGMFGWEREHEVIDGNLYCTVRVWDDNNKRWISKQDVGTESNTEKEKGQASDSFKRACFNFGIGRELYTAPFIWIPISKGYSKNEKFKVKEIGYNENREIDFLLIVDSEGQEAFRMGSKKTANKESNNLLESVYKLAESKGYDKDIVNKTISKKGYDINNFENEAYKVIYKGFANLEPKMASN